MAPSLKNIINEFGISQNGLLTTLIVNKTAKTQKSWGKSGWADFPEGPYWAPKGP